MAATWTTPFVGCSNIASAKNTLISLFNDVSAHYREFSCFFVTFFKIF